MIVLKKVVEIKGPIRAVAAEWRYEKVNVLVVSPVKLEDISLIDSLSLFTHPMLCVYY